MWGCKIIVAAVFVLLESSHAEKGCLNSRFSQKFIFFCFLLDGKENENMTVTLGDMILTPNQFQYLFTNDTLKRHGLERLYINHD